MTFEEFAEWLSAESQAGVLTFAQVADLLSQRVLFDENRQWMELEFGNRLVGFAGNHRLVEDTVSALIRTARQVSPGRMLYFEPIGYAFIL